MPNTFVDSLSNTQATEFWSLYRDLSNPLKTLITERLKMFGGRVGFDSDAHRHMSNELDRAIYEKRITPEIDIETLIDHEAEWSNLRAVNAIREELNTLRKKKPHDELFDKNAVLVLKAKAKELAHQFTELRVTDQYILSMLQLCRDEINVALAYA